jgi:hypothetical protein
VFWEGGQGKHIQDATLLIEKFQRSWGAALLYQTHEIFFSPKDFLAAFSKLLNRDLSVFSHPIFFVRKWQKTLISEEKQSFLVLPLYVEKNVSDQNPKRI